MRVAALKSRERVSQASYSLSQKIRFFDTDNTYPQRILKAIANSSTATSCLDIYHKFVRGAGFTDPVLLAKMANKKETFAQLHFKISKDFATFTGYAIHVSYNMLLDVVAYHHVPFEHCRYEVDNEKNPTGKIAVHPDWAKESGKQFRTQDIIYINAFNPDKAKVFEEIQEAGGFDNYKGQIFYFTTEPIGSYPLAHADSVATWMETQDSCANVLFRNARFNFLPAGIITVRKKVKYGSDGEEVEDDKDAFTSAQSFQGDENALKMLVVEIESDEEKPEFTPFNVQNLDKQFEFTLNAAKDMITEFYRIPTELIGRKSGSMFSTDAMIQAYNVYNSDTESERNTLEQSYNQVFQKVGIKFEIAPKIYIEAQTQKTIQQ